jgi:hypothetical protein
MMTICRDIVWFRPVNRHPRAAPSWKLAIIAALLLLLAGCSSVRLGYNQGPQLVWWWVDGYADFDDAQARGVKASLAAWFDWHRSTQLAGYAGFLAGLAQQVTEPATPAQMCRINEQVRERLQPAIDRAVELAADHVTNLSERQIQHIEARQLKANADAREEYLQPDPKKRREAAVDRAVGRFESLYGSVNKAQRALIEASVASTPFDAGQWMIERERRQLDLVQLLRQFAAERPSRERALAGLKKLADGWDDSPRPEYRARQVRLTEHNCQLAALVHNAATREQREKARAKLKGWEEDLRVLAAQAPSP